MEPKGDLARAYECGPTPFSGRRVADGLVAMSMDTEAALREYLRTVAKVPTIGRIGPVARAFDFVATAAPGIREILTVGKLCFEVREGHYDLVVVDAASTGNVVGQLAAPTGINELIRVGVVRSPDGLDTRDPRRSGPDRCRAGDDAGGDARDRSGRPCRPACRPRRPSISPAWWPTVSCPSCSAVPRNRSSTSLSWPARLDLLARELDTSREVVEDVLGSGAARGDRPAGRRCAPRATAGSYICRRFRLLYLPYLFARSHGLRAVRQVAHALSEELVT